MDNLCELLEYLNEYQKKGLVSVFENEPMKNHTSFKIGGTASIFAVPQTVEALIQVCKCAHDAGVKKYILGSGTNVLFDDADFEGIVISMKGLDNITVEKNKITCGAGASFTAVSRIAMDNSLAGMSFAYGIPGSVGGAVYMNAGAYNGEVSFVLDKSYYLDTNDGNVYELSAEDHMFDYRFSSYKQHPERIIVSAEFILKEGIREEIKAEMDDFMERRRTKQPLEYPSAGSVFKRYPGRYTAQMIEEAGMKGFKVGGACVSEKHAGFIVNTGDATACDVKALIELIENKIFEKYNIEIEREIIYVK